MEKPLSNIKILAAFGKWRWHLLIVFVGSIILAAVFSGPAFIEPKYKSYAVIYPSNLIPYSSETATEQMLQLFRSDELRDSLIVKFDLVHYYKINPNKAHYYSQLIREYNDNVKIKKTEYESVMVEVLDKDPVRACEMVKELINLFNRKVRSMHKQKSQEVLVITSNQMNMKEHQIDSVTSLLKELSSEYSIIDYKAQAEEVTKGYLKTIDGAGASHINSKGVEQLKKNLEEKGGDFILLNDILEGLIKQYIEIKTEHEIALRDVNKELTYTNLVSSPIPADKKVYPIRWLIVFISTLSAMIISFMVILFFEKQKK